MAHPGRRLRAAFGVLVLLLAVLGTRLIQLQGLDGASYAQRAELQRRHVQTLPAGRGAIVDRNGIPLAMSVDSNTVYADPTQARAQAPAIAAVLAPRLQISVPDLLGRLVRPNTRYVVLARDVDPGVARGIVETLAQQRLAGIGTEPDARRIYPADQVAANLLGFPPNGPKTGAGLELSSNRLLAGHDGKIVAELGAGGREIPSGQHAERRPVPGSTVQLTIDRDIQWAAQQALAAQVKAVHADSGTAIVMDPRSGEVLAMATAPTFDANKPGSGPPGSLNPAVSDVYEPGSVNKVITVSGALQEGVVTPGTPVTIPPQLRLVGHTFHDAEQHGTEHLTVAGVLAKSSNIGTIKISQRLGKAKLHDYLRAYGFGELTGVGLLGESRGILPPTDQWSASQQYTIPFGQGVSVTALQVASVYATIANGGVRAVPTLLRGTIRPDGSAVPAARESTRRVVSAEVARQVRNMLEAVTSDQGTAPAARIAGYRIAGKTGTAQRPNPACSCYAGGGYTASFVGFAPADNPQLLVGVVLQKPRSGHFGGQVAAPVFQSVMSFALKSREIPPTGTRPPTVRLVAR